MSWQDAPIVSEQKPQAWQSAPVVASKDDNEKSGIWDKVKSNFVDPILGFGRGLAKGAVGAAKGALDIGQEVGELATGTPKESTAIEDTAKHLYSDTPELGGAAVKAVTGALTDKSGEKAGELAFNIAPFAAGGSKLLGGAKALEDIRPEPIKHHEIAAEHAKLPKSDAVETPVGQDIESKVRETATKRYEDLKQTQKTQGNAVFDRYFLTGEQIEKGGAYFTTSEPGIKLIDELSTIEKGGAGDETAFGKAMRTSATKLRKALSGVDDAGRKPVNLRVVDEELRELRAKQYDTGPNGFNAVKRARFGQLADKLESAVKKWVGDENYPREEYAALSKDLNKYNSKLGKILTGRQDLEYVKGSDAPFKSQAKLADAVFKSRETVAEARSLMGDSEVNQLAEHRFSNEMRGKTSAQAIDWLDSNPWVKDVPGLMDKAKEYTRVLWEREGDAESGRRWKKIFKYGVGSVATGAGVGEGYRIATH